MRGVRGRDWSYPLLDLAMLSSLHLNKLLKRKSLLERSWKGGSCVWITPILEVMGTKEGGALPEEGVALLEEEEEVSN